MCWLLRSRVINTENQRVTSDWDMLSAVAGRSANSFSEAEGKAEMAVPLSDSECAIWEKIELSESYLVCCMFEEARSLASSVLECIRGTESIALIKETQLNDMRESAGMVLVQSLKELGRTSEILNELNGLFSPVTATPVQVLLTGACILVSEGSYSGLTEFLGEFLCKWRYVNGRYNNLADVEANGPYLIGCDGSSVLEIEKYFEVAKVYAVALHRIGTINMDTVIVCAGKAELPDEKQEELARRLQSLCSLNASNLSEEKETPQVGDENTKHANPNLNSINSEIQGTSVIPKTQYPLSPCKPPKSEDANSGKAILRYSKQVEPCFWWYHTFKFGNACVNFSYGKMLLWCLVIFGYYILRKKRAFIKWNASRLALTVKKALVDMWQLAFSIQVNPLAAVQQLPAANHGAR